MKECNIPEYVSDRGLIFSSHSLTLFLHLLKVFEGIRSTKGGTEGKDLPGVDKFEFLFPSPPLV